MQRYKPILKLPNKNKEKFVFLLKNFVFCLIYILKCTCDYLWLLVATRGYLWLLVAICGYLWLLVATCGYSLAYIERYN